MDDLPFFFCSSIFSFIQFFFLIYSVTLSCAKFKTDWLFYSIVSFRFLSLPFLFQLVDLVLTDQQQSVTWRYLGNQVWYHRFAGVKTTDFFWKGQKCFKKSKWSKWPNMVPNGQKCWKMVKMVKNDQKLSKIVKIVQNFQSDLGWTKMVQHGLKGVKKCSKVV